MNKELQQNIQEVGNVFERMKGYSYEDIKEFYAVVSEKLEALDEYRIENKTSLKAKEFVRKLNVLLGLTNN